MIDIRQRENEFYPEKNISHHQCRFEGGEHFKVMG